MSADRNFSKPLMAILTTKTRLFCHLKWGFQRNLFQLSFTAFEFPRGKIGRAKYGSAQRHSPTHRYRRDGAHHHQRQAFHSRPPSPSRISYRKPQERRYDGGHRAGFRSAQNKRGGYGKYKNIQESPPA